MTMLVKLIIPADNIELLKCQITQHEVFSIGLIRMLVIILLSA